MGRRAWQAAVHGVAKSRTRLSDFTFTFHFYALQKEMATHSSVLAWRIPGMGEPGGLPSMGSHRVGHDWSDLAAAAGELLVVDGIMEIKLTSSSPKHMGCRWKYHLQGLELCERGELISLSECLLYYVLFAWALLGIGAESWEIITHLGISLSVSMLHKEGLLFLQWGPDTW